MVFKRYISVNINQLLLTRTDVVVEGQWPSHVT